jgi:hypothetical protein
MMKDVDKLHHDTTWKPYYKKVNGSKGTEVIQGWCRDTVAVLRDLFADKMLAKHMHYRPQKHWTTREQKDQQYGESWRSKHWWNAQVSFIPQQVYLRVLHPSPSRIASPTNMQLSADISLLRMKHL